MRRGLGGIVIATLLALPASTAAQDHGAVVATSADAKLHAREGGGGVLCITLVNPTGTAGQCADEPSEPMLAGVDGAAGGAVAPDVARVEVEWVDGSRTSATPAESAAHPTDRGQPVRFFVVDHGRTPPWLVRLFDAEGRLVRALVTGEGPQAGPTVTLVRGSAKNFGRWSVKAHFERDLAPGPGEPDRVELLPCLTVSGLRTISSSCIVGEPRLWRAFHGRLHAIHPRRATEESPRRYLLAGFLGSGAATLEAQLGDGRRARLPVRTVSGPGGERVRAVGWTVPAGTAMRGLTVLGPDEQVLGEHRYGLPPSTVRSSLTLGGIFDDREPEGPTHVAAGPVKDGEGTLRVLELAARLCVSVDGSDDKPCGLTPRTAEQSLIAGGASEHFGVVGGIVPPEVATVELIENRLFAPDPATVRVATQAPAPYTGAFAPHVRAFVALLPTGGLVKVRLLDADGREVAETGADAFASTRLRPRLRTVLRVGKLRLRTNQRGNPECFTVDDPVGRPPEECTNSGLSLVVACRPAASVVTLRVKGRRDPYVVTRQGRRIVPRRTKRFADGAFAFFVVPAPDLPRAIAWKGGGVAFGRLPSPRKQCGYSVERSLR